MRLLKKRNENHEGETLSQPDLLAELLFDTMALWHKILSAYVAITTKERKQRHVRNRDCVYPGKKKPRESSSRKGGWKSVPAVIDRESISAERIIDFSQAERRG
jgi:hypothetical protein